MELSDELRKQISESVTNAAIATTKGFVTDAIENVARTASRSEAATAAAEAAKQFCSNEVQAAARQAAGDEANQRFQVGLSKIDARCNVMATSLQRAGVAEVSD